MHLITSCVNVYAFVSLSKMKKIWEKLIKQNKKNISEKLVLDILFKVKIKGKNLAQIK